MSDPVTALKGMVVQTTGSNAGSWGSVLNSQCIALLDGFLAGVLTLSLASSSVQLTAAQVRSAMISLTGTLVADVAITAIGGALFNGFYCIDNQTAGAFKVSLSNGVGNALLVPQGSMRMVFCDATYGTRCVGQPPPGTFWDLGSATAHASLLATSTLIGEYLLCAGGTFARTGVTANLFQAISTTWGAGDSVTTAGLPDLRGRARFGKDTMGGSAASRLTTAGGGVDGATVGASGGGQSVTIAQANMPNYSLTVTDPGHTHTSNCNGLVSGSQTRTGGSGTHNPSGQTFTTNTTGVTVASGGSGTALASMNPCAVVNVLIKV